MVICLTEQVLEVVQQLLFYQIQEQMIQSLEQW